MPKKKKCDRCGWDYVGKTLACDQCSTELCGRCCHSAIDTDEKGNPRLICDVCYLLENFEIPFTLICSHCDAEGEEFDLPSTALLAGWSGLTPDLFGFSWNFLGDCPDYNDDTGHCEVQE